MGVQEAANFHADPHTASETLHAAGLESLAEALSLPAPASPDPRDRHGYYSGLLDDGTDPDYWPALEFDPGALNPSNCPALDPAEWPLLSAARPTASSSNPRSITDPATAAYSSLSEALHLHELPAETAPAEMTQCPTSLSSKQHGPVIASNSHHPEPWRQGHLSRGCFSCACAQPISCIQQAGQAISRWQPICWTHNTCLVSSHIRLSLCTA